MFPFFKTLSYPETILLRFFVFLFGLKVFGQLISKVEGTKSTQWGKGSLLNKWCLENWISTYQRMELQPYLIPYFMHKNEFQMD